jgi:membrane protease YdiL (CAAX protease family)
MTGLNLLLLLLVAWIEAPEEIFFRGYIQNHLQEHVGANWAALLGAIIWDAWHISAPAEFFRRLLFALLFSLVFRARQNTTSLAVVHPLLNRLLVLFFVVLPARK